MTVASRTESTDWMSRIAFAEPAPPTMKNSLRLAFLMAARTPTPWSSSWFQIASIFGAAWSRLEAASSPDSTVNSAATRLPPFTPQSARESAKPLPPRVRQRVGEAPAGVLGEGEGVDAGDLGDDGVGLVAEPRADVRAGGDPHAVVVAEDRGAGGERAVELAVDVDDRDAGVHRLLGHRGQRGAVEGQQDDGVDAVVDEGLDLADLGADVVGALGHLELDVVVLVGRGLRRVGDAGHPAVVGGRGREPDGHGVAGLVVVAGRVVATSATGALGGVPRAPGEKDAGADERDRG